MNIVFLPSRDDFTSEEKKYLRKIIRRAVQRASSILNMNWLINVTVYPFNQYVNGKPWVIGSAQSKEWFQLTVPPKTYKRNDLLGTIYHEMHHMARGYCILHNETERQGFLLNSIFSEGLATTFEIEQTVGYIPEYACYDLRVLSEWFPKLKEEMWRIDYDHEAWFFGDGWMGYKLGKCFVDQIIKNNPTYDSVKLLNTSAEELLKLSRVII